MVSKEEKHFPFEIKDVEPALNKELMTYFVGELVGFVQVGPKRYFLPNQYKQEASNIYNIAVRPEDTFLLGYPRSGTTWSRELVWLVANDLDYDKAKALAINERFPFLESNVTESQKLLDKCSKGDEQSEQVRNVLKLKTMSVSHKMALNPSRRFVKTHLPLSLLPPALLDIGRVVFVARDPRDVAVSFYHFRKALGVYEGDFKTFWNYFVRDLQLWAPFFGMVKEAWEKRNHPHMLFWFYEDMIKDLPAVIGRVAQFYGKSYSEEQIRHLCDHLAFDNFKNNNSVNSNVLKDIGMYNRNETDFIRKGQSGGWREYMDEETRAQAQRWLADNLRGTDLRFPGMEDLDLDYLAS